MAQEFFQQSIIKYAFYALTGIAISTVAGLSINSIKGYKIMAGGIGNGALLIESRRGFISNETREVLRSEIMPKVFLKDSIISEGEIFIIEVEFLLSNKGREAIRELENSRVRFNLAGAKIEPKTPQVIGSDLKAAWSVSIDNAGIASGFIEFIPQNSRRNNLNIEFSESRVDLLISSTDSFPKTVDQYVKSAGLVFGLLLSLINIIRFFWAYNDRKSRNKKLYEKKKKYR